MFTILLTDSIIFTMNVLLILGLVLFTCTFLWVYIKFLSITVNKTNTKKVVDEAYENPYERCKKLYAQGMHAELQRYAQRELAKNFANTELRRILAQSFMETGNEDLAIAHYEAILSISPQDIETREFLANYYCENGPKSKAIELYEQIFMYDSGNINAVETLAKLYEEASKWDKAVEMYKMLLDAEVDETKISELQYTLANLYTKINNDEKAFEVYRNINKSDPENLEILIILADLAYKNKYWKDCLAYYNKIISIVGDDFEILEKIAQIHVILENWNDAVAIYKKIISMEDKTSSNYIYHKNELCNAMLKTGDCEEAINILKELNLENPKETSIAFSLAQAYALVGKYQSGINLYNNLLDELPPENSDIIIRYISDLICSWAEDLFKKGEYNQAFDKFFEALKYDEENDKVYYELGKCNYYIKSFQDAIGYFKRAISIKPQESKYYFGLGCAYDESGSVKNAKIAFYDAININPMDIKARIAYAISLTKELEYAQSIEQFTEILKYIPNNADTLYNLALAYELIGDYERAITYYKKAIDENNDHKEAMHNLELLIGEPYVPEKTHNEPDEIIEAETVDEAEVTEEETAPEENTQQQQTEQEADNFHEDEAIIKYDDSMFN